MKNPKLTNASDDELILVKYEHSGYGADVFTLSLMTKKKWNKIMIIAKKYPEEEIANEMVGGRTSDTFTTYSKVIVKTTTYTDSAHIEAFKLLAEGDNYIGNANIFEFITKP